MIGGGWAGRRGLRNLGRYLTNRETHNYFKETSIAKSHKSRGVVERHCAALEFTGKMAESKDGQLRDSSREPLSTIGEYANTDSVGKQYREADVYDNAQISSAESYRIPCSGSKGKGNAREEKGNRGKLDRREENVTNWEDQTWGTDNHQIQEEEYE